MITITIKKPQFDRVLKDLLKKNNKHPKVTVTNDDNHIIEFEREDAEEIKQMIGTDIFFLNEIQKEIKKALEC